MDLLSFGHLAGAPPAVQAEVPKKVLCGIQTCQHIISIENDFCRLFTSLKRQSKEIRAKSETIVPTITSRTGEMMGLLKAFQSLTVLLSTVSGAADAFVQAVENDAIRNLQATTKGLQSKTSVFLEEKSHSARTVRRDPQHGACPPTTTDSTGEVSEDSVAYPSLLDVVLPYLDPDGDPMPDLQLEPLHGAPIPQSEKQRLSDKLLLASQEYERAVAADESLKSRFGNSLRPELREKSEARIQRAELLKIQAEQALARLSDETSTQHYASVKNSAPYIVIDYDSVDQWELDRLTAVKKSLVVIARSFLQYQTKVMALSVQFASDVDEFFPMLDEQMWLSQMLKTGTPDLAALKKKLLSEAPAPIASDPQLLALSATLATDLDVDSTMKGALRDAQREAAALKVKNEELTQKCRLLQDEAAAVAAVRASQAARKRNPPSKAVAPMELPKEQEEEAVLEDGPSPHKKKKGWGALLGIGGKRAHSPTAHSNDDPGGGSVSRPPQTQRPLGGGQGGSLGEAVTAKTDGEVERRGSSLRPSHTVAPVSQEVTDINTYRDEDSLERLPLDTTSFEETTGITGSPAVNIPAKTHAPPVTSAAAARVHDEFLPDLLEHLSSPISQHSEAAEAEYYIEIQRRFEEFLLALRGLDLSPYVRVHQWSHPAYFRGPDTESGFHYFPYKLPGGIPHDVSRDPHPIALEWGAPKLDDRQWGLLSYETLLLVYLHLANKHASEEVHRLPHRDINSVSAEVYASNRLSPGANPNSLALDRVNGPSQTRRKSLGYPKDGPEAAPGGAGGPRSSAPTTVPTTGDTGGTPYDDTATLDQAIGEDNLKWLQKLIVLTRIRQSLAGRVNSLIVQLTLPSGSEYGRIGQWTSIHPLDVRYRVVRLLDTWTNAESPAIPGLAAPISQTQQQSARQHNPDFVKPRALREDPLFQEWAFRQIHVIHTAICFKLWRLVRFLPNKEAAFECLGGWTERGPWHRTMRDKLPRFQDEIDEFFFGRLNTLMRLFELALEMISALTSAIEEQSWGIEVVEPTKPEHMYCSAGGIRRLLKVMACIASLDKLIRIRISEDERGLARLAFGVSPLVSPKVLGRRLAMHRSYSHRNTWSSDTEESEDSVSAPRHIREQRRKTKKQRGSNDGDAEEKWKRYAIQDTAEFNELMTQCPQPSPLDLYWAMETPMLQLVLSYLWQAVPDSGSPNGLHVDAPALANALMITTFAVQIGQDPSALPQPLPFSIATLSAETQCLMLADALWKDACAGSRSGDDDEQDAPDIRRAIGVIPASAIECILKVMDVDNFSVWFCGKLDAEGNIPDGRTVQRRKESATAPAALQAAAAKRSQEVTLQRAERLLANCSPDPWDVLCRVRGANRALVSLATVDTVVGNELTDATDPDFFVVDVSELQEARSDRAERDIFEAMEAIREQPEGVSLVLPSRVERVMMEVLINRLISARFRSEIASVLCDYRYQLEPEALLLVVQLWDRLHEILYNEAQEPVEKSSPDLNQFNINSPLPELLRGPTPRHDLYRYFICQSMSSLAGRLFTEARVALSRDPDTDLQMFMSLPDDSPDRQAAMAECGAVVKVFGEGMLAFVAEVRGELEFYPQYWTEFLPGNQHPMIVLFAARLALFHNLQELLDSPYWPDEDVPPGGNLVLEGIEAFERLTREVRLATRLELSSEPDLLQNLTGSLTAALTRRFQSFENAVRRCLQTETWEAATGRLHSNTVVDLFTFVHHLFNALVDMHSPIQWMVPCFLQFLGHLSTDFASFVLSECEDDNLLALRDSADLAFAQLWSPHTRVEGGHRLLKLADFTGNREKKHKTPGAGLLKGIGKLAFGRKKKKDGDQFSHPNGPIDDDEIATPETRSAEVANAGGPGGPAAQTTEGSGEGEQMNDAASDSYSSDATVERSVPLPQTAAPSGKKKHKKKKKKKQAPNIPQVVLPDNFDDLSNRYGAQLALRHVMVQQSLAKTSIKSWLVRLHNLQFFVDQLPALSDKFQTLSKDVVYTRDPRYRQIHNAIADADDNLQTEESRDDEDTESRRGGKSSTDRNFVPSYEDALLLDKLQGVLENAIGGCQNVVQERAKLVCRYISLRLVYVDFGEDLFEEVYSPVFKQFPLERVICAFRDTVERFIGAAPETYQSTLKVMILEDLVKCWMLLVTEMGYQGTVFLREDVDVMERDLNALREFAISRAIDPTILVRTTGSETKEVNLFDYVGDFLALIANKPESLAKMGGNYDAADPLKKRREMNQTTEPEQQSEPGHFSGDDPVPVSLDQIFSLDEIAGGFEKKKKKKGWTKMLGL